MKKNMLAVRVSVVALCVAAFALATPAHAQKWVFMGAKHGDLVTNTSQSSGGPTVNPPTITDTSLVAASGGTGAQFVNGQSPYATCNYDLPTTVTYMWQGGGTPTSLCPVTRTDTLTATVTLGGPQMAVAACGVDTTNEVAAALIVPNNPQNTPSDAHKYVVTSGYNSAGAACSFDISVNANATGYVLPGGAFTAKSLVSMAFK